MWIHRNCSPERNSSRNLLNSIISLISPNMVYITGSWSSFLSREENEKLSSAPLEHQLWKPISPGRPHRCRALEMAEPGLIQPSLHQQFSQHLPFAYLVPGTNLTLTIQIQKHTYSKRSQENRIHHLEWDSQGAEETLPASQGVNNQQRKHINH